VPVQAAILPAPPQQQEVPAGVKPSALENDLLFWEKGKSLNTKARPPKVASVPAKKKAKKSAPEPVPPKQTAVKAPSKQVEDEPFEAIQAPQQAPSKPGKPRPFDSNPSNYVEPRLKK
jgi:hypothetical protein